MIYRMLLGFGMWLTFSAYGTSQIERWTTVQFGNLKCEFPESYSPIEFSGASGIYYDGGNVYLTVTSLPDTSSMKGDLNRDFTRDFMNVVLEVSRKLNGKVREFRDTVIANRPGYISKLEISTGDGRKSFYELLQLVHQDSMRGFSCQYFAGDTEALKTSHRFFASIGVAPEKKSHGLPLKPGLWIGGILLLLAVSWAFFRPKPKLVGKAKRQKGMRAKPS